MAFYRELLDKSAPVARNLVSAGGQIDVLRKLLDMSTLKVERRGMERSVLIKDGVKVVAEVFTHKEPGDQYDTAQRFAASAELQGSLRAILEAKGVEMPDSLRAEALRALKEAGTVFPVTR